MTVRGVRPTVASAWGSAVAPARAFNTGRLVLSGLVLFSLIYLIYVGFTIVSRGRGRVANEALGSGSRGLRI